MAPTLGRLALEAWRSFLESETVDAVVPVPLYPRKEREREFNQAEEIARAMSPALKAPVRAKWLRRLRDTRSQTELKASDRRRNVRGAFAVRRPEEVRERRILLIDDVFTTGATIGECARVLRKAGAARILVATPARD